MTLSPTESDLETLLRSFCLSILPAGNAVFSGSISGTTLTVDAMAAGTISVGDRLIGEFVLPGSLVVGFLTGAGGTGTYSVYPSQTSAASAQITTGVEVVRAQDNRVAEPESREFITVTPMRQERLATNIDQFADIAFLGFMVGNTLTVNSMLTGALTVGLQLYGDGVAAGTFVTGFGTGTGGVGTYTVTPAQTLSSLTLDFVNQIYIAAPPFAAGTLSKTQKTKMSYQLDVHGPNGGNHAAIISTLFRSEYGTDFFTSSGYNAAPISADDPKQVPFINGEQQFEDRWVVDVLLQANLTLTIPQQYADTLTATSSAAESL